MTSTLGTLFLCPSDAEEKYIEKCPIKNSSVPQLHKLWLYWTPLDKVKQPYHQISKMSSLFIETKVIQLAAENPQASILLERLDEAETSLEIQEALYSFDTGSLV